MKDVRLVPYQKKFDYTYSLGVFPTIELLESKVEQVVKVVFNSRGKQNSGVQKLVGLCGKNQIRTEWNDGLIKKLGGGENTYALGVFLKYFEKIDLEKNHLVLVNPEDGGNLGTMLRTALAFGIENVAIVKPAVDVFDPKTVRASMGSIFKLRIEYFTDFESYKKVCKNECYVFMTAGAKNLDDVLFSDRFSLVFGGESAGLPREFAKYGESVVIPQSDKVDSLNLAIEAGIAMYTASTK